MKRRLPRSIRKYIRYEKARIRREFFFDIQEQKRLIDGLYARFLPKKEIEKKVEEVNPVRSKSPKATASPSARTSNGVKEPRKKVKPQKAKIAFKKKPISKH